MNKAIRFIEKARCSWDAVCSSSRFAARVARGGAWVGVGSGLEQLSRLVRNMLLTRILAPEAFGLMAIVLALNAAFEAFTEVGVKEAVIQHPDGDTRTYLNGAWWFAFVRALFLYMIVFVSAPVVASIYEKPDLTSLLRFAFLGVLFNGTMSVNAYVAMKKLRFAKWVVLYHGGSLFGIATAIVLGYFMQNVWALVFGFVVEGCARWVLSYIVAPFLPRLSFDKKHARDLLRYAKGMFGLPILTFVFLKADVFVVGKFFPMNDLGLYSMASSIAWMPFAFITMLFGRVMMPAFSEKQHDLTLINQWTIKSTSLVLFFGMPMLVFLLFYGKYVLMVAYGQRYMSVATPLAIIFFTAMIRTCSVPIASVYLAIGKPELHRLFTGIRAALILVIVVPCIKLFGLSGAAIAGSASMLCGYVFQVQRMRSLTGLKLNMYLKQFAYAVCASLAVVLVWMLSRPLNLSGFVLGMVPGIIGCVGAYAILTVVMIKSRTE